MRTCLQCGCELPADAPKDLCPKCLMGAALGFAPTVNGGADVPGFSLHADTPERIGSYKILQKLGEGGCGIVYLAEQEVPIRRRVALKLIKLGMDTKQVIARFEAERQALALMNHPNVAKVLNAGASETGRPYFVMELVRGLKITEYCDKYCLSTRERLELFLQVCRAIQHAHQKGIIHRDIKPSNILVTQQDGKAVPMVIDFGIAKATGGQALTNKTLFTTFEQIIGTPAYMSPEQAERRWDVDTRTDIYSLGVVLYELLTGKTPFDSAELIRGGWDVIRRKICETEPQTPSTRLTTLAPMELNRIARCRRAEAPKLIHGVRGDLDWIVMKCLEKETARRYETSNAIAGDIERHLNNEPVMARPVSNAYRLRKLVSRNRLLVGSVAGVVLALLMGMGTSIWFYLKAKEALAEAQAARARAEKAEQISVIREQKERNARKEAERALDLFRGGHVTRKFPPKNPRNEGGSTVVDTQNVAPQSRPLNFREVEFFGDHLPATNTATLGAAFAQSIDPVVSPLRFRGVYEACSAEWWRWLMELPRFDEIQGLDHPAFYPGVFDVTQGQGNFGKYWFLASPFGSVVRECVIPADVWLYIGLVNVESSSIEDPSFRGETMEQRANVAGFWADHIFGVEAEIDGIRIADIDSHRIASPDIRFFAPTPWIFGENGGPGFSSGDGYFILLRPLSSGEHVIHYKGGFIFTKEVDGVDDFALIEMTYKLTILER